MALLETLNLPDGSEMVTLYHLDGNHLGLTHYCSHDNQPRTRATPVGGEMQQLAFLFVGATNLASRSNGHMHRLVVTFDDNDHFTMEG